MMKSKKGYKCSVDMTTGQNVSNDDNCSTEAVGTISSDSKGAIRGSISRLKSSWAELIRECLSDLDGENKGKARYSGYMDINQLVEEERRLVGQDLIVLSGPSGVGKDAIAEKLLENIENAALAISCTTREPRQKKNGEREQHGVDYFFIVSPAVILQVSL